MSDNCYYHVNIDVSDALNPKWRMPVPKDGYGIWSPTAGLIFSKTWLNKVADMGLPMRHALLFYRGPNMTSKEAHVDTHAKSRKFINFAFNWIIGGENSAMHWYNIPDQKTVTTVKDSSTNVPYTTYQFKDLELLESCSISNKATLVKTCVPHSITMGEEPRWCISARPDLDEDMQWDDIVGLLRSKNLLIER